ncbi:acetate/propionate family kinase [Mucilaginibacter sp. ZT4R22]|uniref:Acetate kinase n=1 Tax=Mucilaginibacter pankratovii TaxID=2772110 RepID=A0ABR7WWE3_9SPHI|nr:acetate/propionate family kinase [Mucilaginibacter pankratovii]MBD1366513.1 acetate/propionate family kinase [Mucilaginibacter pankratovii]
MKLTEDAKNYILCINGGSSSLKFGIYEVHSYALVIRGQVGSIGKANSCLEIKGISGQIILRKPAGKKNIAAAADDLIEWLKENEINYPITAIGHRLVQGGPLHRQPELITLQLLNNLQQYVYLAPNHLPDEISTIEKFISAYPHVRQIACFDTAFHAHMPAHAKNYPLPAQYLQKGLFKYGFHGLSYSYIMQKLKEQDADAAQQKIIIAHLGNGASMAAVDHGISIDTTMGISPIGGLVMGTRCGDLDPGVLLFLMNQYQMAPAKLDELFSKESGLKAIAGVSDMQELMKKAPHHPEAEAALKTFCYSAKKFIGALAAALEGLDTLIFTGGIGENAASIRDRICQGLDFIGIELDPKKNTGNKNIISKSTSRVTVRVIKTDEELMIAQLVNATISQNKH